MAQFSHHSGLKWQFDTKQFSVTFEIQREHGYQYDGDDPDGETQAALNRGDYVAFTSLVEVRLHGELIGRDSLHGSVYAKEHAAEFWTAHRDEDAMNRNCSVMRAARGNVSICHYFPDMIREATREARRTILARRRAAAELPRVREV